MVAAVDHDLAVDHHGGDADRVSMRVLVRRAIGDPSGLRSKDGPDPAMAIPGAEDKVIHAMFRIGETALLIVPTAPMRTIR
jgi:hypothetical protein